MAAFLMLQMTALNEELDRAYQEIARLREENATEDEEWEREILFNDHEDDETVEPYTTQDMMMSDDEDSDTETVILEWEDPFLTPNRERDVVIPYDYEEGLGFLNDL